MHDIFDVIYSILSVMSAACKVDQTYKHEHVGISQFKDCVGFRIVSHKRISTSHNQDVSERSEM